MSSPDCPTRVMYMDYTGAGGRAARSLELLIRNLPAGSVEAFLLTPAGPKVGAFREAGVEVITIPAMMNLRSVVGVPLQGMRWLTVIHALGCLRHGKRVRDAIRQVRPDLVHLNEQGMYQAAWLCWQMGIPVVAHARSIADRGNRLLEKIRTRFAKCVNTAIAIDESVRLSLVDFHECHVIYDPVSLDL